MKKDDGKWKISGVRELSRFESDWAPGEPRNGTSTPLDCVYLSKEHE